MEGRSILNERLGETTAFTVKPQVAAVDYPPRTGLYAPRTGTGDGMVNRKAAQVETAFAVSLQGAKGKLLLSGCLFPEALCPEPMGSCAQGIQALVRHAELPLLLGIGSGRNQSLCSQA